MNMNDITNWDEACSYCAEELPLGTKQDSEGTVEECFLSGWVNAADMIDDGELDWTDDAEVLRFVFSEVRNMHPESLK